MITWIHGQSKSGKTTLARKLIAHDGGILLDGDAMRRCWTLGFLKNERWENNVRIAKLAKELESQGFDVVVATICPYRDLRNEVYRITGCRFIALAGGVVDPDYPYED